MYGKALTHSSKVYKNSFFDISKLPFLTFFENLIF